jgi:hypothetical protein
MVQLRVYTDNAKTDQYYIDLYDTEPIKLNLSIEDITDAEARSVFSRTFRVPATGNNNQFFKHSFLIEGIDYDVTVKKPAVVLVDGAEFRQGHIRLQKIYVDKQSDRIDYEIVFLGETRDFSSAIGDTPICDLDIPALSHSLGRTSIVDSWNAYPQSASSTAGLVNGDVIYPLIDHGNVYPITQANPRIALNTDHNFTSNPLPANRMKPMIRAKALWDAIFERAGYTYTSEFIEPLSGNPNIFTQLYVSAFGNEASPIFETATSSSNNFSAYLSAGLQVGEGDDWYLDVEVSDVGNNWTIGFPPPPYPNSGSYYTAPMAGNFTFEATCYWIGAREVSGPTYDTDPIDGRIEFYVNGTSVSQGTYGASNSTLDHTAQIPLSAGDTVTFRCNREYDTDFDEITNCTVACTVSPGEVNPVGNMDCEYKQIDFIKDVLTTFRLVMAPDSQDATNFIIEPFVDYVENGDFYDWSDKLVGDKDQVIEPLFFTQSDEILFTHEKDSDWLNKYHEDAYKNVYGYLKFDSGNELLTGQRKITTKWAPTPITQIQGAENANNADAFIIPQLHVVEQGEDTNGQNETQHLPIRSKTRFLFYTGLQPVGHNQNEWELVNNTKLSSYPLVMYSDTWPLVTGSTILNWRNDVGYWGNGVSGYPAQAGQSLYNLYWSGYINSLYSKYARRLTAYFILNNVDLQTFSFDDVIFVNGSYYRPEKIIDAQIGSRTPVKVQLIKLFNYQVPRVPPLATLSLSAGFSTQTGPCNETVVDQTVTYYPELIIGNTLGNMNVVGSAQYFKIISSTQPGFDKTGWIIGITSDLDVFYLQDICTAPVYGCTDPTAQNYDPAATVDDGSCTYGPKPIYGCTDPAASNYDPNATVDDGSCIYTTIPGCTDPAANNYNPNATVDDGSCTYDPPPIYGCTDPAANNYDPFATVDDGSCTYDPVEDQCYQYFVAADGGEDVQFQWTNCDGTNDMQFVVNGDFLTIGCAIEGSVSMMPSSGTISQIKPCN